MGDDIKNGKESLLTGKIPAGQEFLRNGMGNGLSFSAAFLICGAEVNAVLPVMLMENLK